jgi:hypothetical protein
VKRSHQTPAHQAVMAEREDAIVALLEERPYLTGELGTLCSMPSGMGQILSALARGGRIRRLHDHRWALPHGVVTDTAPPRDFIDRDAVLRVLQHGPTGVVAIARHLNYGEKAVQRKLDELLLAGDVRQISVGRLQKWSLVAAVNLSAIADDAEDLDDVDELDLPRPPKRQPKTGTRQAAGSGTMAKDQPPSWWCTAPRDGFTAAAIAEAERMRKSKEARLVPWRLLA